MTPEQEDEIRSMIQGLEDRTRDTSDSVGIQTDILGEFLQVIANELRELRSELKEAKPCIHSEKQVRQ